MNLILSYLIFLMMKLLEFYCCTVLLEVSSCSRVDFICFETSCFNGKLPHLTLKQCLEAFKHLLFHLFFKFKEDQCHLHYPVKLTHYQHYNPLFSSYQWVTSLSSFNLLQLGYDLNLFKLENMDRKILSYPFNDYFTLYYSFHYASLESLLGFNFHLCLLEFVSF